MKLCGTMVLFFALSTLASAQNIESIRNVPFTATRIYTSLQGKQIEKIARSADGSTCVAEFDEKGNETYIHIKDIPGMRNITLFPQQHLFDISSSADDFRTYTVSEWLQVLRGMHSDKNRPADLPEKVEAGMTLFGFSLDFTTQLIRWEAAELGTTCQETAVSAHGLQITFRLADIRMAQPDIVLFKIPMDTSRQKPPSWLPSHTDHRIRTPDTKRPTFRWGVLSDTASNPTSRKSYSPEYSPHPRESGCSPASNRAAQQHLLSPARSSYRDLHSSRSPLPRVRVVLGSLSRLRRVPYITSSLRTPTSLQRLLAGFG